MLWAFPGGELELRAKGGGYGVSGRFPYNATAVMSDGGRRGRPQKERIGSRAFGYRVEREDEEIRLLFGHDANMPLASRSTRTLSLRDTDEALTFNATISPEIADTSFGHDAIQMMRAGLAVGISPGFRIPPTRAVARAESVEQEAVDPSKGMHGAIIRTVLQALLYELSIVSVPAYKEATAQIEARNWSPDQEQPDSGLHRALNRWRA